MPTQEGAKQEFALKAQGMSVRISELAGRIGELTRMARQSTMFEDTSPQINALTAQVKAGLQSMVRSFSCLSPLPPCIAQQAPSFAPQ